MADLQISPSKGVCGDYAQAFQYLCDLVSIPCITVKSKAQNHGWNLVYVDQQWLQVDVTHNDQTIVHYEYNRDELVSVTKITDGPMIEELRSKYLLVEDYKYPYDDVPIVRFVQEVLVPGSTVGCFNGN